jgi:hypothetical protein
MAMNFWTFLLTVLKGIWNTVRGWKQWILGAAIVTITCFGNQWFGLTDKQIIEIVAFLGGGVLVNKVGNKLIPENK